jgi:hypothetical protein
MPQYSFLHTVWGYITEGLSKHDQSFCKWLATKYADQLAMNELATQMEQFLSTHTDPCAGESGKQLLSVRHQVVHAVRAKGRY